MDPDELVVLRSFAGSEVRFLIIGGRAVQFHGYRRLAKDLDLLVEFSARNWQKLSQALQLLNAEVPPFESIAQGRKYHGILKFFPTVELLTSIKGVSFEDAWRDSIITIVDDTQVRVISKLHLLASKQGSSRPSDVKDISVLLDDL